MTAKQPTSGAQMAEVAIVQLDHIDSELCWCEPIIDFDEIGHRSIIHNEVTWN